MTKEEFEFLKEYEYNLTTATKSDYSRNVQTPVLRKMVEILERNLKIDYRMNYNCASCQLRLLKSVGRLYFEKKAEIEKKQKKEEPPVKSLKDEAELNQKLMKE